MPPILLDGDNKALPLTFPPYIDYESSVWRRKISKPTKTTFRSDVGPYVSDRIAVIFETFSFDKISETNNYRNFFEFVFFYLVFRVPTSSHDSPLDTL